MVWKSQENYYYYENFKFYDFFLQCERLFRTSDIVSVTDKEDGLCYFAQIRALLSDQFGKRFAAFTW